MKEMSINTGSFIFFHDTELDTGFYGRDKGRNRIIPPEGFREGQCASRILALMKIYQISATWIASAFSKPHDIFESIVEKVTVRRMKTISKVYMARMVAQSYGR